MAIAAVVIGYEQNASIDARRVETWIGELAAAASDYGCVRSDFDPPLTGARAHWSVKLDFGSAVELARWFGSPEHHACIDSGRTLFGGPASYYVRSGAVIEPCPTVLMTMAIAPDAADSFVHWQLDILAEMFARPGFSAVEVYPPASDIISEDWTVVVRFDTEDHLDAWLTSEERARLHEIVDGDLDQRDQLIGSSFAGWFEQPVRPGGVATGPPPRWKQAMAVLAVLYPTVVLLGQYLTPRLEDTLGLSLPQAVFVQLVVAVAFLTWVATPLTQRILNRWLHGDMDDSPRSRVLIPLALVGLYLATLTVFSLTL